MRCPIVTPPAPDVPTPATPTPAGVGGGPPAGRPIRGSGIPGDEPPAAGRLKARGYGFDKGEVRALIERHFRVYEERDAIPGLEQAVLVAFYVLATKEEVEARYPTLQSDLKGLDPRLMPVLREEGGETIIVVTRRPEETRATSSKVPQVLLVATALTLTAAGSIAWVSYDGSIDLRRVLDLRYLALGFVGFAVPLLFVFGVQEVVRRLVARRHEMRLGPSFLVPVPPFVFVPSIGTFGSVLNARDPWPSRKALFDVAAAGPIAGFLAAIPVVVIGLLLTNAVAVPVPDGGEVFLEVRAPDGTMWSEPELADQLLDPFERSVPEDPNRQHNITVTFSLAIAGRPHLAGTWNATAVGSGTTGAPLPTRLEWRGVTENGTVVGSTEGRGEVAPGGSFAWEFVPPANATHVVVVLEYQVPDRTTLPLGEPLAFTVISSFFATDEAYVIHPVALAGWAAFLVIGVTLIPAGRLDGGAAARALFGDRMVWLSYLAIGALAVLSFVYPGWVYLVLFIILFLGARHPAPLNESTPLDNRRRILALLLLILLVLSFVPVPAEIASRGF